MEHKNWVMLTYKPSFPLYDWTANEQLDVYTNNLERTRDLPLPSPTDEPVNLRLTDPDINNALHSINPTDVLKVKDVVSQLTDHFSSEMRDVEKVQLLYHWLASQDLKTKTYNMTTNFATMDYQLRKLQNKENSYAALFLLLCNLAKVPCVIIRGYVKVSPAKINQAEWNAVLVDGHWRLVDTFWGAHLTDTLIPTAYYLFPDPQKFIYSHWAESVKWQLLNRPIRKKAFEDQEYLTENFFLMNMSVLRPRGTCLVATDGELDLSFGLHAADTLQQEFQCITGMSVNNGRQPDVVYKQPPTNDGQSSILRTLVRFQEEGNHVVQIIGNTSTDDRRQYDWVAIYNVSVTKPSTVGLYPSIGKSGWGPGWYLAKCGLQPRSHPYAVITCNTMETKIEFEVTGRIKLADVELQYTLVEFKNEHLKKYVRTGKGSKDGRTVYIVINMSGSDHSRLTISATIAGQDWENVCVYYIDTAALMENDCYKEVLHDLRAAYKSHEAGKLKPALERAQDYKEHRKVARQFQITQELYRVLVDYEKNLQRIKAIDTDHILKMKMLHNPVESIQRVMRAMFTMLSSDPKKLVTWEDIQKEITSIGKRSVQRRIKELDLKDLDHRQVNAAKREIEGLNAVESTDVSQDVAPFIKWLEKVFHTYDILHDQKKDEDSISSDEEDKFENKNKTWYTLPK